jgi:hypothetical protein
MQVATDRLSALGGAGHLCFPYESEEEKRETVVRFVRDGLLRHERCLYIGSPADQAALLAALGAAGVPAARAQERGALVFATQAETYRRAGRFDPDDALTVMEELTDRALADGYAGLRGTGEASGPVPDDLWRDAVRYEALLNERLGRRPFLALCRFPIGETRADRVRDVLRTHPHALVRGEVCANPFYERAEVVLSDDSQARLDWQLHQLRTYNRARRRLETLSEAAAPTERLLTELADELSEPLFALKREVHALASATDAASEERFAAAQRELRRLSAAIERARVLARARHRKPDG